MHKVAALSEELIHDIASSLSFPSSNFGTSFLPINKHLTFLLRTKPCLIRCNSYIHIQEKLELLQEFVNYLSEDPSRITKLAKDIYPLVLKDYIELTGLVHEASAFIQCSNTEIASEKLDQSEQVYRKIIGRLVLPRMTEHTMKALLLSPIEVPDPILFEDFLVKVDRLRFETFEKYKAEDQEAWDVIQSVIDSKRGHKEDEKFCHYTIKLIGETKKKKVWHCDLCDFKADCRENYIYEKLSWHYKICHDDGPYGLLRLRPILIYEGEKYGIL